MPGTGNTKAAEGRRVRLCALLLCLGSAGALLASPLASGGEFSATATVTSEYVYRGQALSGGNPALQAGVDYEHGSGLFAGAWASTVDLENAGGRRDAELDVYVGYHFAPAPAADLSVTVLRYTYPGQTTYFNYDYTELLVTATLDERYSFEFGYSDDIYGWNRRGRHGELRADWPLPNAWVLGAGLGYNELDDQGTSNYWYWDFGASARYARLMIDLRWYDNESPEGTLAYLSAGSQFVVSLSAGF
jgi:uncharacterized protein (TIGR02001 family)